MHYKIISNVSDIKYFFICFLFFGFESQAQWLHDTDFFLHDQDTMYALRFDYGQAIASDAITNQFILTYLREDFIDSDLKDEVSKNLDEKNLLGGYLNAGFAFRSKAKNGSYKGQALSYQWVASIKNRILFNTTFSDDFFKLYFYGNKIYEGQQADISNFNYSYQQFQQFQLGMSRQAVRGNKTWTSMLAFSYLNGQDYLSVKTTRGTFYTATDAEYVDLDLALTAQQADSNNNSFGAINGVGFSTDYGIRLDKGKWKYSLQISDLGFIQWNKKSSTITVDTNYRFEGVEVQNLLDSFYIEINSDQDFKNGLITTRNFEKFTKALPAQIMLTAESIALHPKIHAYSTLRYRFNSNMLPLVLIVGDYLFSKSFYVGLSMQYGGYSKLHGGVRAMYSAGKGWMLYVGSSYLDGFFLQNNVGGVGGSVSVQKVF